MSKNAEEARRCRLFREKRRERVWLCGLWDVTTIVTTHWSGMVRVLTLSEKLKFIEAIENAYMLQGRRLWHFSCSNKTPKK